MVEKRTIEEFLLLQFWENQELSSIENSLSFLENGNEQMSISDIANKVGLNLKTFQRSILNYQVSPRRPTLIPSLLILPNSTYYYSFYCIRYMLINRYN